MTTPADTMAQEQPMTPTNEPFLAYGQWLNDPIVAPYLQQVEQYATGRGYPMNEIEFQELLNQETLNPSFSLKGINGLTAQAASCIIWSEIETNFYNALAHVREAQELFSDNATFEGSDVDVIRRMRATSMDGQNTKINDQKKTFFAPKKKKDESPSDKKGKRVEVEFKGEDLSAEAPTVVPATPREEKEREKKEKKEKKKAEKEEKKAEKEEKKKEKKEKKGKDKKEKDDKKDPKESPDKPEKKPGLFTKLLRRGNSAKDLKQQNEQTTTESRDAGVLDERALSDDVMGSEPGTSGRGDNSARDVTSAREIDSAREINSARYAEESSRVLIETSHSEQSNP